MSVNKYWKDKWKNNILPVNSFAKYAYSVIKKSKAKNVLDVGCGSGQDSIYFYNKGFNVTSIDFSESGIKKLQSSNKNIKCFLSDIQTFKFKPNLFDIIYAHLSLHYFDEKITELIFKNLYKALKKNGFIFVKCKSINDPLFGKGEKLAENIFKKGHVRHFFSKGYMIEKLKGYKIASVKEVSSSYNNKKSSFIEAVARK